MRQANYDKFRASVIQLEKQYGLKLSDTAKEILYLILDAIVRDPHPRWKLKELGEEPLDNAQAKAIEALPDLLGKLNLRKLPRATTTFEILHAVWPILNGIIFKDVPE